RGAPRDRRGPAPPRSRVTGHTRCLTTGMGEAVVQAGRASLFAVSDLHVSHGVNRRVAEEIRPQTDDDWLIVAGDVADLVADVEWALRLLSSRFRRVIWVPGNHELWTPAKDPVRLRGGQGYGHC